MYHVLIIEDEPLLALDLQDILSDLGVTSFDFAATENEAIEAARRHAPDIITSDVKLLEGTGPAAVDIIYRERGEIPVLFITATPEACEPCNPPGQILPKPINAARIAIAFRNMTRA
ncbi:response regulator [Sphingomonas montanisoli]|uniref:Response regulator n=1 Tax=Sphingomonas montanisoli TaxID=2606412 RepID=A0A5D9C658_9SPHN|nr:response regulator [Sphingomonas montanisoli]TZG27338.1 response regulator [Sphingomonas montanisoli]